ncbi:MAG: GNAT family N-acetyltransferase [Dehalococcoidia bacterium]
MQIRAIRASEGLKLREIRLRALAESPDAFGTTLAQATAQPEAGWHERAVVAAAGERQVMFVAEADGHWAGLAGGFFDEADAPDDAELISMWVEPEARRSGVAVELIEAVVGWAQAQGAPRVRLWVTLGNVPATRLYERMGFVATGETASVRPDSALREQLMVRPLATKG